VLTYIINFIIYLRKADIILKSTYVTDVRQTLHIIQDIFIQNGHLPSKTSTSWPPNFVRGSLQKQRKTSPYIRSCTWCRYSNSLRVELSGDRNTVEDEIFRIRPHRPWGPRSHLYNEYRVSFPGGKRSERDVDHSPPSRVEVKERIELYLYSLCESSWPVTG